MSVVSHPVDEKDSSGAGGGGEILLSAVDKRNQEQDVRVHAALFTQVQLLLALSLPALEVPLHNPTLSASAPLQFSPETS